MTTTDDGISFDVKEMRSLEASVRAVTADAPLVIERVRDDENIEIHSLEAHLPKPLRTRGSATVNDPADYAQYVNRLVDPHHTTLWADVDQNSVTAVIDDHHDHQVAGWRSHRVHLALKVDPDWKLWLSKCCLLNTHALMTQEMFAEFLESVAHTVIEPDAATMMEVALNFRATKKADFSGGARLDTGDLSFSYHEETTASTGNKSGKIEVPALFKIRVSPWLGTAPVELVARLRYRLDEGKKILLGYALQRPDLAKQQAFDLILAGLRETVDVDAPLFKGTAPAPVQASS